MYTGSYLEIFSWGGGGGGNMGWRGVQVGAVIRESNMEKWAGVEWGLYKGALRISI